MAKLPFYQTNISFSKFIRPYFKVHTWKNKIHAATDDIDLFDRY